MNFQPDIRRSDHRPLPFNPDEVFAQNPKKIKKTRAELDKLVQRGKYATDGTVAMNLQDRAALTAAGSTKFDLSAQRLKNTPDLDARTEAQLDALRADADSVIDDGVIDAGILKEDEPYKDKDDEALGRLKFD